MWVMRVPTKGAHLSGQNKAEDRTSVVGDRGSMNQLFPLWKSSGLNTKQACLCVCVYVFGCGWGNGKVGGWRGFIKRAISPFPLEGISELTVLQLCKDFRVFFPAHCFYRVSFLDENITHHLQHRGIFSVNRWKTAFGKKRHSMATSHSRHPQLPCVQI